MVEAAASLGAPLQVGAEAACLEEEEDPEVGADLVEEEAEVDLEDPTEEEEVEDCLEEVQEEVVGEEDCLEVVEPSPVDSVRPFFSS